MIMDSVARSIFAVAVLLGMFCQFVFGVHSQYTVYSQQDGRLQYNREFLLQCRHFGTKTDVVDLIPPELVANSNFHADSKSGDGKSRLRKRGKRGGVRQRLKRQGLRRVPLPTIVLGLAIVLANVQSLTGKTDELQAAVRFQPEYRDACLMAFTETWLNDNVADSELVINGFGHPFRLDRDKDVTSKARGGGVCLYVNDRWCNNVIIRESICTSDIELLSVSLRPFYLPREFPQLFVTVVYIHPKANVNKATDVIFHVTQKLQSISPDAPNLILGDFNRCSLKKSLPSFSQYVTCPTRYNKTIDLCYGSIARAYKSIAKPPLGSADHNTVYLIPVYKSKLRSVKPQKRTIRDWTNDSIQCLRDCFDSTDWDMFIDCCSDIDELTEVICSYISFCEDSIIPKQYHKVFANNKPWVTKSLKFSLNKKKIAFQEGNMAEYHEAKKEVRREIRKAKHAYKERMERNLSSGSSASAWDCIKVMAGLKNRTSGKGEFKLDNIKYSDCELAEKLNTFYVRFDVHDFRNEHRNIRHKVVTNDRILIDKESVFKSLRSNKIRKSPGPDNISGHVLKFCAGQLCEIFQSIFQQSLDLQKVPKLWKRAVIVPVAKKSVPKVLNDFRPVALTSLAMKSFEKLIKAKILEKTQLLLDPLQFAYRSGRGVEDATLTLLNFIYKHLEGNKTHARILFVDFSSAFNTIQPHLLAEKLMSRFNLHFKLVGWILDFLTNRSQCVRVNRCMSKMRFTSTGSPQGCVLSPLLYILYTDDCRSQHVNRHILKFADDSAIVSLLNNCETGHGPIVDDFIEWCNRSFLQLNVGKTKDMCIDFRRSKSSSEPTVIDGSEIEIVSKYNYLGSTVDDKLCWDDNVDAICSKGQQRVFFLRKLNQFNVNKSLMTLFYKSFIESICTFSMVCWYGNLNVKNRNRISKIVKVCSNIIGEQQVGPTDLYEKHVLRKGNSIIHSKFQHPLQNEFDLLPSGCRFRVQAFKTNRTKNFFINRAIGQLNRLN